jgi:hypothetical protein
MDPQSQHELFPMVRLARSMDGVGQQVVMVSPVGRAGIL